MKLYFKKRMRASEATGRGGEILKRAFARLRCLATQLCETSGSNSGDAGVNRRGRSRDGARAQRARGDGGDLKWQRDTHEHVVFLAL